MARNTIHADVPPESVWEVLADPRLYGNWVVGASTTNAVDGRWPEVGATLHHTQLMVLNDTTTVVESEPARRLVLEARTRPILVARVDVQLEPEDGGTRIVLDEEPVGGLAATAPESMTDPMIHLRNGEAVRRLKRLAELGHSIGRD
jgi:uncharacterized protein YndB with AHSA1/START domain